MRVVVYECTVVKKTDKAMLIRLEDDREIWIALVNIDDTHDITSDSHEGDEGEIAIPQWIAEARGLS